MKKSKYECILIEFMDSLRDYVAESGTNIALDERDSSEFVKIFLEGIEFETIDKTYTEQDIENAYDKGYYVGYYKGYNQGAQYNNPFKKFK